MLQAELFAADEFERFPSAPRSSWRMPVQLVRDAMGRFKSRPLPPMPDLGLVHADLEQVLGGKGKRARALGERQLWIALWWGDRLAAHEILERNRGLVDHMIDCVGGRDLPLDVRMEARGHLMADLLRIIQRHVPSEGHVYPWMAYKLKYSAINWFVRTRDAESRRSALSLALAASPQASATEHRETSAEALDARDSVSDLHDLAGGSELSEPSWLLLNLMLAGLEPQQIKRQLGWPKPRFERAIEVMRCELRDWGVMD
jgi:hypothetical protein